MKGKVIMAKKKEVEEPRHGSGYNRSLSKISQRILSLMDGSHEMSDELDAKSLKFHQTINRELDLANGVSHGSILDFVQAQRESNKSNSDTTIVSPNGSSKNLFTDNIDQIYNYLVELYDNKYLEMMDLKYISKFIPVLGQSVKTTLDHVVASDDIADTIKRQITFDIPIDDENKALIITIIEQFEKDLKLLKKLKNFTFKNTLITGSSYIYAIPFNDLFAEYAAQKQKTEVSKYRTSMYKKATEGYDGGTELRMPKDVAEYVNDMENTIKVATESVTNIIESIPKEAFEGNQRSRMINESKTEVREIFDSFTFINGPILDAAMEQANAFKAIHYSRSDLKRGMRGTSNSPIQTPTIPDGAKDPNELKKGSKSSSDIPGSYVKFIEARDIVPLKIFDETVGYYHIVNKKKKKNTRTTAVNGGGIFASSMEMANQKKEQAVNTIVDSITNMVIKNFDQKFLMENQEFKKLIADCIISKGIVDNEYSIQFIPAKYIYEFKINETPDGQGESMLADSLLPGKMLLSYLVSKLLLFVNNSGDKTLVTTHKGPIDLNTKNQIDRAVRQLEGGNITFGDFLSPNIMFNKFNRNANILLPTANNGTKLLEFEKLEGKNMDMATDMEEKLEKMAIIGSGVPDSIMEYVNDLQFSRQVVSSSIKYAGYVSSIQSDMEDPLTDLYRALTLSHNLPESAASYIPHMYVGLPRPKVVTNGNNNENIRTGKELSEMIAALYYGEEADANDAEAKRQFILETCKNLITFYNWDDADKLKKDVDVKYHGPKKTEEGTTDTEV